MKVVQRAHTLIMGSVDLNTFVVDATAGTGRDTLLLAERVGPAGRVFAFDIQSAAEAATKDRLAQHGWGERLTFFRRGHEEMESCLPPELRGRIAAVMFNLGYLPGGDKSIITTPATTVAALSQALQWIAPGGLISVAIYRGHPGGESEYEAVTRWMRDVPTETARVERWVESDRAIPHAPELWSVTRLGGQD
jgi:predicted methyltransferase